MDKTQKNLTSFQKGIGKTMAGIGALFGGIAIGTAIKSVIQSASELESAMLGLQSILWHRGGASLEPTSLSRIISVTVWCLLPML
jgi:hypothetical protein